MVETNNQQHINPRYIPTQQHMAILYHLAVADQTAMDILLVTTGGQVLTDS